MHRPFILLLPVTLLLPVATTLLGACAAGQGSLKIPDGTTDADTDVTVETDTVDDPDTDTQTTPPAPMTLCINEFMPDNKASLPDETGQYVDWIELHNPTDADVSLRGWSISDDPDDPTKHVLDPGLSVPAGGFLVLFADAIPEAGTRHLSFSLSGEGEAVGLFAPDGGGTVVEFGPIGEDLAFSRVPDCCTGDSCWQYPYGGSPEASNVASDATTPVLPAGSAWRYFDQGAAPVGWQHAGFDDSAWPAGPAPLGYGDSAATPVGFGPDPLQKHVTTYFRSTFQVPDPAAISTLRLRLRRDDGAVVYVNGLALLRNNLPGVAGPEALAVNAIEGDDESVWLESTIWLDALNPGANTIAVEVHQAAVDSDDLAFDLELLSAP